MAKEWNDKMHQSGQPDLLGVIAENINVDDLLSLINSFLYIRSRLHSQLADLLFPKVWQILGKRYEEGEDNIYRKHDFIEDNSYGKFHLFQADDDGAEDRKTCTSCGRDIFVRRCSVVLKLRLVSRDWCAVIDNYYERTIRSHGANGWAVSYFQENWFNRGNTYLIDKFLKHFMNSHGTSNVSRSPFVARSISLIYGNGLRDDQRFVAAMSELLSRYGHHVRFCAVEILDSSSPSEIYTGLRQILIGMENLKSLELVCNVGTSFPEELKQLDAKIRELPLPSLKNLQNIRIRQSSLPLKIYDEILQKNCETISKLHIVGNVLWACKKNCSYRLPNLRELSIHSFRSQEVALIQDFLANCPLPKLDVSLICQVEISDLSRLFSIIMEKWADSLVDLTIDLPMMMTKEKNNFEIAVLPKLSLSKVRHLRLSVQHPISLDFILSMKQSLQYLEVAAPWSSFKEMQEKGVLPPDLETGQTICFFSCLEKPLESNIWTNFPRLEKIRYCEYMGDSNEFGVYSRLDWRLNN